MIALNDWHQDIMKFIQAKRDMSIINGANVSVAISEEFMVSKDSTDADWNLGYVRADVFNKYEASYYIEADDFVATSQVSASEIWDEMMRSAWSSAEPGVIFMGRYNDMSNSRYFSEIIATNPCGKWFASR